MWITVIKCLVLHTTPQTGLCPYVYSKYGTYGNKNRLFHKFTAPTTTSIVFNKYIVEEEDVEISRRTG